MTDLTYQVEDWQEAKKDIVTIANEHLKECAKDDEARLNVNMLDNIYEHGMLHVTTCRNNGDLLGYVVNILMERDMYYDSMSGSQIGWYIKPEARGLGAGKFLLKESERLLKDVGCKVLFGMCMVENDATPLFEKAGWTKNEYKFMKKV